MSDKSKFQYSFLGLGLLFALMVALIVLTSVLFRGWRLDFTEDRLYTMSEGSRNIAASIDEPINVYYFFSDKATANIAQLRLYGTRVKELLQEFEERSGGKLKLQIIDPQPFSEEEDRAAELGLQPVSLSLGSDPIYFGMAATNSVGDEEVIPFFDLARENFLEYDVAKAVSRLANPVKPIVGVLSGLPISGGFDPQTRQMSPGWVTYEQLSQLYEVRDLGPELEVVPDDVELLWVVHPKNLSSATMYALDQYILAGGKTLLFVDPHAEIDIPPTDPNNPQAAMFADRSSNLPELFEAWGIRVNEVILDDVNALQVGPGVRHLGIIGITAAGFSQDDVVVGALDSINFAFPGAITTEEEAAVVVEPLIQSSDSASSVASEQVKFAPSPEMLRNSYKPGNQALTIAARISGKPKSAFPDGQPSNPEEGSAEEAAEPATTSHIDEATDNINVVLVADADVLSDRLWAQVENFFGQRLIRPIANNGDFLTNAVDNFSGSADLIGIRGRAGFSRPFTRVDDLRREAEERYRQTEQGLQTQLEETERKLAELQANREDTSAMILTEEQSKELGALSKSASANSEGPATSQKGVGQRHRSAGNVS